MKYIGYLATLFMLFVDVGRTLSPIEYSSKSVQANIKLARFQPLIVGGDEAPKTKFLFTTGLRFKPDGYNYCGAALISRQHVLTAAHCVNFLQNSNPLFVSVGSHYLNGNGTTKDNSDAKGQQIGVAKIIVHPKFESAASGYDAAILILETPAKAIYKPVQLAAAGDEDNKLGEVATVIGWGTTSEGGTQSPVKLQVKVPIVSQEHCQEKVSFIHESMICAGGVKGQDACQGDSGGPLITQNNQTKPILVGIVSWGVGCAREGIPGVYSRVSFIRPWIDNIITASQME